jgi:hypothetical protein
MRTCGMVSDAGAARLHEEMNRGLRSRHDTTGDERLRGSSMSVGEMSMQRGFCTITWHPGDTNNGTPKV